MPPPPPGRKGIRNNGWKHMYLDDILSMPDSWEYPFFAAWGAWTGDLNLEVEIANEQ